MFTRIPGGRGSRLPFRPGVEALEDRVALSTYYVSNLGSDANPGTDPNHAWQTTTKVNHAVFQPGDTILFQGGQTFTGGLSFSAADSGTAANPVTVGSYGTGRATISSGTHAGLVGASGLQGFVVRDLMFVGPGNSQPGTPGLKFLGSTTPKNLSDYLRVINVDVSQYGGFGISLQSGNPYGQGGWQDVQITNSVAHDNRDSGISFQGFQKAGATTYSYTNIYLGHDTVYGNTGYSGSSCSSGNGIVLGDVTGATVERCTAYDNGLLCNTPGGGPVGIWSYDANAVTIQHCESYGNGATSNTDGAGFDIDGGDTNCIVQYCYSHDNQGAGYLVAQYYGSTRANSNNTIRFNVSQNDGTKYQTHGEGAVTLWNDNRNPAALMSNISIYDNTVYSAVCPLFVENTPATGVSLSDNIFYAAHGQYVANVGQTSYSALSLKGNDYFSDTGTLNLRWGNTTYTTLAAFQARTGQEMLNGLAVGANVDPQLNAPGQGKAVNNADNLETSLSQYKLRSSSTMGTAGVNLVQSLSLNPGSQDFYDDALPPTGTMAIGGYQHMAANGGTNLVLGTVAGMLTSQGNGNGTN